MNRLLEGWIESRARTLGLIIERAKEDGYGIDMQDNHFFTYYRTGDGKAWVICGRDDSSSDADKHGRPPGIQSCVFEMPVADAQHLEALIRKNPVVFRGFLSSACPGLDRSPEAPRGSPGLLTKPSPSVIVIDYDVISPAIEIRHGEDRYLRHNSLAPFIQGKFSERWERAATRYEYTRAA